MIDLTKSNKQVGRLIDIFEQLQSRHQYFLLVGTKSDSPQRKLSNQEMEEISKQIGVDYIETSALTQTGIKEVIHKGVSEMFSKKVEHIVEKNLPDKYIMLQEKDSD